MGNTHSRPSTAGATVGDVNSDEDDGINALVKATWEGHLDMIRNLVEQGADVNAKAKYSATALVESARNGHFEVVRYLIEHGADINGKDAIGDTAVVEARNHVIVVRYLIEQITTVRQR
ncbi:Ankyrin repeat domain-containing protein 50 [Phytophthora citrophthora]|uniref:Ankyrin repeat domain-containing protein 50 n=1 Tax=Phytophthora citrophthora TaxID=4793 RepID=A0AAD9LLP8_9STRA|nr:Ankyrin repeat domain-containing protein 50 [Phytophthora citrophthora]